MDGLPLMRQEYTNFQIIAKIPHKLAQRLLVYFTDIFFIKK